MTNSKKDKSPDTVIVTSIKNGDKTAFKELYYRYYEQLYRFLWYRTHSDDLSREYLQELFFRIWTNRKRLSPNKSIKAYLYKSLNNLLIDSARLHSSKNVSLQDVRQSVKSNDLELDIDIQNAIDNLPPKIKDVYLLSRYEGFKYSEIAEIYSISIKGVEKRMSQAFKILRKVFPEQYFS